LLELLNDKDIEILKPIEGDIIKHILSAVMPESTITLFVQSALSDGYRLANNSI
jgi:hypothetical protein